MKKFTPETLKQEINIKDIWIPTQHSCNMTKYCDDHTITLKETIDILDALEKQTQMIEQSKIELCKKINELWLKIT